MFFIKSFLQMCLYSNAYDAYLFLEIKESKNLEYLTPAIYNDHANVIKFMKVSSNSTQSEKRRNTNN